MPMELDSDALVAGCAALSRRFAERAPEYDREGKFPVENFDDLKKEGLLGIMVPASAGGMGADFFTYTRALEQLARGDASTALTFNMHNIVLGGLAELSLDEQSDNPRLRPAIDFRRWAFREATENKRLFASATSEPGVGATVSKVRTQYRRVEGGYVINGVKSFVSMAGHADYYVVAARAEHSSPDVPTISYLVVERGAAGVTFDDTWDVLGMRGTSSNSMRLEEVFVPSSRLFMAAEGMVFFKVTREPHWLVGGYNGVYLGICSAAFDFLTDYLKNKRIPGTDRPFASDPVMQHQVGLLDVALASARAVTMEAARLVKEKRGTPEANVAIHRAKYLVGELGPHLTSQAIKLCGAGALSRRFPLERHYRDARCGGLMPARSDDCLGYAGKVALGIDPSRSSETYW